MITQLLDDYSRLVTAMNYRQRQFVFRRLRSGNAILRLISLLVFLIIVGIFIRSIQKSTTQARQTACAGAAASIQATLALYKGIHGDYPAPILYDDNGRPMHSWRMLLAKELSPEIYGDYKLNEAWDSPANSQFVEKIPTFFICVNDRSRGKSHTSYVMLVDTLNANSSGKSKPGDVHIDSSKGPVLVVEMAESGIPWTKPVDLDISIMSFEINHFAHPSIRSKDPLGPIVILKNLQTWRIDPHVANSNPAILRELLTSVDNDSVDAKSLIDDKYFTATN